MSIALELSQEQEQARQAILDWAQQHVGKRQGGEIRLAGYAGTGKTTLIGAIVSQLKNAKNAPRIGFCTITGKASNVLKGKLQDLSSEDFCGTIHSLLYAPVLNQHEVVQGWIKTAKIEDYDLLIVDEASMVNREIYLDLMSFGVPILFVGDHGQLPPVGDEFNLMSKPNVRLETIHRQAENNPIIRLSMIARKEGALPVREFGEGVSKIVVNNLYNAFKMTFNRDALYLCGYNGTRVYLNDLFRQQLGVKSKTPIKGEKVICLRNNKKAGVFNGMTGLVQLIEAEGKDQYHLKVAMDDQTTFDGYASRFQFGTKDIPANWSVLRQGNLFDYGYCLTVHKAQGSEADSVVVIEQRLPNSDDSLHAKWLYTAITRARKQLLVLQVKS